MAALHAAFSMPPQSWNSDAVVGAGVASTEGAASVGECVGNSVGEFVGDVGAAVCNSGLGRHFPHFLLFGVIPQLQSGSK